MELFVTVQTIIIVLLEYARVIKYIIVRKQIKREIISKTEERKY